jgi:peptidoglycan/xylan/chitin deacetylase (PgdA/CDA1 family)
MKNAISLERKTGYSQPMTSFIKITERVYKNTHKVLEMLAQKDTKCTFFIQGLVAAKKIEIVKIIHDAGNMVQSHGFHHELVTK